MTFICQAEIILPKLYLSQKLCRVKKFNKSGHFNITFGTWNSFILRATAWFFLLWMFKIWKQTIFCCNMSMTIKNCYRGLLFIPILFFNLCLDSIRVIFICSYCNQWQWKCGSRKCHSIQCIVDFLIKETCQFLFSPYIIPHHPKRFSLFLYLWLPSFNFLVISKKITPSFPALDWSSLHATLFTIWWDWIPLGFYLAWTKGWSRSTTPSNPILNNLLALY